MAYTGDSCSKVSNDPVFGEQGEPGMESVFRTQETR
jgi:hypothetical protein